MISRLACIEIPFNGFNNIPVELAVDVLDFKESSVVQHINHIARTETVESLKSNTPHWYKKYFEDKHETEIKETYVVASKNFYNEIDFLDKDGCEEFSTNSYTLYSLDPEKLIHHGRVLKFLEILGLSDSTIYERIDGLFVPPVGYKQVADVLKRLKVVFITGVREYGKTFNAIRLMWETSEQNGCLPSYISTAKLEKLTSSEKFEYITDKIKANHIIYVEDPLLGEKQAELYALDIRNQTGKDVFIYFTNRYEIWYWNKSHENPRMVKGFHSRENLERIRFQSISKKNFDDISIKKEIADRPYQLFGSAKNNIKSRKRDCRQYRRFRYYDPIKLSNLYPMIKKSI